MNALPKLRASILATLVAMPSISIAQERTELSEFVENGFAKSLGIEARSASLPVLLGGGDPAVYFSSRTSEFFPTSVLPVQQETRKLSENIIEEIGDIKVNTMNFGEMSLNDFLAKPESYAQGFIVLHKGEVVFEKYPGMRQEEFHVWMSVAKVTASLVIDLMIAEGKIDETKTMGDYVPEFLGTPTGTVTVRDVLDMTTGLNADENPETRSDPNSIAIRTFKAEFNHAHNGKVENLLDVLKDAEFVAKPGDMFQYSSSTTQLLVYLAEAVENKRWTDIFNDRVWSKIGAEAPMQLHATPDGVVAAHGLMSSNLRDLARFGTLYTPSWNKFSTEQVVDQKMIDSIHNSVRSTEFYLGGYNGPAFQKIFDDKSMLSNSRQWDIVWPDGDMWKGGLMSQGLYVSPSKDLVIAYFSTNPSDRSIDRFLRPIAQSELLNK